MMLKIIFVFCTLLPSIAWATLATEVTALTTSVTADFGTIETYAFAILAISLTLSIGIKLIKKYSMKVT